MEVESNLTSSSSTEEMYNEADFRAMVAWLLQNRSLDVVRCWFRSEIYAWRRHNSGKLNKTKQV